jgi:hypothetical protein
MGIRLAPLRGRPPPNGPNGLVLIIIILSPKELLVIAAE